MDPEQTFLRVHARLSGVLLRVLTPNIRTALEYHHFAVAVALSCSVVVMHTNFVQQISSAGLWSPTKSASSLIETLEKNNLADSLIIRNADGDGFPLFSAKYWFNWIISGLRNTKLSR